VLCGSDQIARGAIDALREAGRDVPGDVAVIGHDNWEILATGARPELTSVDMNLEELGRLAARRLAEAIDGHGRHGRGGVETIGCRVVPRGSTAPVG
jgi:LacI family transcriptional regulator